MNTEPIVIPINGDASDFIADSKRVSGGMDDMGNAADIAAKKGAILSTVLATTSAILKTSYDEYSKLAESVRDLSLVSGESAESTSRFIQVLDDYQITAGDAEAAAKKLKDNGLSPTIDTLATLSDQFRGIKDPAERLDFVYDKLGKSGAKFINMLNQGSDAIRENAAAINESLILNDMEIKMYEVGRLAIDAKADALAAFRVELGQNIGNVIAFADAMQRAAEIQEESTKFVNGHKERTIEYADALNMAIAEQLKAADASAEYKYNLEEEARALKEVAAANAELMGTVEKLQSTTENFADQYQRINEDMSLSDEERKARIAEVAAAEEEANRRIILSMLEKQLAVDGLDARETEYLLSKGQEWGIYSEEVIAAARDAQAEVMALAGEINAVPAGKTVTFDIITNGAPPNLDTSTAAANAPVGTHRTHADGGSFMIPMGYGNEGFRMGSGDTASGGELVQITPRGQDPNKAVVEAIYATRITAEDIARAVVIAAQQVSK